MLNQILQKLIPQEETKRVAFDLKLYGNGAYQVYWDDSHTKVIKFYHVPVQYLRAEKLDSHPRIENYFYCRVGLTYPYHHARRQKNCIEDR